MSKANSFHEVIHEMRNELAVARANLEGFVDGKFAPTHDRVLGIIQALTQIDRLIDDLRVHQPTASMPVHPVRINACALLDREYQAMEAVARERHVTVLIERCPVPAPQCLNFYGDPARIGQIIKNVLLNAIRYTPKGGTVSINCSRNANQIEVRIADSGPGLAKADEEHIFESGYRGSASSGTQGSGYGLSVVKQLVEGLGGSIEVSSTQTRGATFTVRLPGLPESQTSG
jgi:two-component system, OmpR family, sensor histidine kinase BaeS